MKKIIFVFLAVLIVAFPSKILSTPVFEGDKTAVFDVPSAGGGLFSEPNVLLNDSVVTSIRDYSINGETITHRVYFPSGASRVMAICAIEEYTAKSSVYGDDADMGWNCYATYNNNSADFVLEPLYSNEGRITASFIVVNLDAFDLHYYYEFTAYGHGDNCVGDTVYTDLIYGGSYEAPSISYPPGSIPIVTVNQYDTWSIDEPDDDMAFSVYLQDTRFTATAWDGCGVVRGYVAVLSPVSSTFDAQHCWIYAQDVYPYNVGYEYQAPSPECNMVNTQGWSNHFFSSLVVYDPRGDDHFSALDEIRVINNVARGNILVTNGNDESEVWFLNFALKGNVDY